MRTSALSLIWIKSNVRLEGCQHFEHVFADDHDAVAVEADRTDVFESTQRAADRLWRGGEVRGNRRTCHTGSTQGRIIGLLEQKTRQPHDNTMQRQVFDLLNKAAHTRRQQSD